MEIDKLEHLLPLIRQYGSSCMAYSSLQEGLEYEVSTDVGFIAYLSFKHFFWSRKGVKIVLADPVCELQNYHLLISSFIKKHKNVIFIQSSEAVAKVLDNLGYEVNQFGTETEMSIPDFNLKGKSRSKLRQWRNKCKREEVVVSEVSFDGSDISYEAVNTLSKEWVKQKGGHEYILLTRPLCYHVEPDVRYFQACKDGVLLAFAVFDPIYEQGKVVGYYHNVDRQSRVAPHGTGAYIILQAMDVFKNEGIKILSLGMSPLYEIKRPPYKYNNFLHEALWFTYRHLEFIYPFKGNAGHKRKFNGMTRKVFFSSTQGNSLWQLLLMLKALKLF